MSGSGAKCRAPHARACRGVCGYSPPENFEDSLLGNKPYKDEGSKDNNSGTFLNSKRSFRNRTL